MKTLLLLTLASLAAMAVTAAEPAPNDVLQAAPVRRGLCVHVCDEDGSLAEALAKANPVIVFALASNAAGEARLRGCFAVAGIHGQATAGTLLDGNRLPLNDDLAALLVADLDASGVRRDEALRVVRPFGKAYLKEGGKWQVVDKPRPAELDDWPQYFHDGAMSDLSADNRAGPARGLQWEVGPSTTHSLGVRVIRDVWVSADDGGIIARDAFNGLPLWRRPDILVRNRFAFLADDQRVYVYPEAERDLPAPCMLALDLRAGATVRAYSEGLAFPPLPAKDSNVAKSVIEALRMRHSDMQARLADGILTQNARDDMVALDAASGKRLWVAKSPEGTEWAHPILFGVRLYAVQGQSVTSASYTHWPMTLVQRIVAMDLKTGRELWAWDWSKEMPGVMATQPMPGNHKNVAASLAPPEKRAAAAYNMALAGNLLVLAVRSELDSVVAGRGLVRQLVINAATGKFESYGLTPAGLDKTEGGGHSHLRVLPVKDRIWFVEAISVFGSCDANAPTDSAKFRTDYAKLLRPVGCTVYRASPNYLFGSLTTYALDGSGVQHTNVARTTCDVGAFPANGMTYITPNHCFCQPYLPGNNAFSPRKVQPAEELQRLERGKGQAAPPAPTTEDAWPMFLRDGLRSSWSVGQLPAKLAQAWTVRLSAPLDGLVGKDWEKQWYGQGPVTGASVAEGVCVVALTDRQQIAALDPATGKEKWRATLDGRIDSQPTIRQGLVLAGTRTGWVCALNRDTGELVWRFFAAPRRERIVADGQLESPWPLFGTVYADSAGVWAFAGRHNDCDGGLWWWRLEAASGAVLSSGHIGVDELRTNTGSTGALDELPDRFNGANSPVLTDGKVMLLARIHLERKGGGLVPYAGLVAPKGDEHVFWQKRFAAGMLVPGNQGLLNRNAGLYGYKMSALGFTQARQFAWRGMEFVSIGGTLQEQTRGGDGGSTVRLMRRYDTLKQVEFRDQKRNEVRTRPCGSDVVWESKMVLSGKTGTEALAVAGTVVLVGASVENRDMSKERDRMPHRLIVLSFDSGEQRQELPLPASVILSGISAANGRVFVVTADGTLTCFTGGE